MKSLLIGLLIVILIVGGGVYLFSTKRNAPSSVTTENISPNPQEDNASADPQIVNDLKAGGSSYSDPDGVFSILYPNDYKQDSQNNGEVTRFFKQGPTQKGQTEMYDGVIVTIEKINLQGKTLSQWVDETLTKAAADGTSQIIEGKKAITMNTYPGYTYTMRGLGEFKALVMQKDTNSPVAIRITQLIADPGNLGFQKEADAMLSTLSLLK